MTLSAGLAGHKALLGALLVVARAAAERLGLDGDETASDLARKLDVNRTYLYEVAQRLLAALEHLASAAPGRPRKERDVAPTDDAEQRLTIVVLRYRVDHPGAVLPSASGKRTEYAPAFRRFLLEQHDVWPAERTLERFAAAVEVPLDTLRDWIEADRKGLTPPASEPPAPRLPQNASDIVVRIAEMFKAWQGSTRPFLGMASRVLHLLPGQVLRVLVLTCMIRPPRPRPVPGAPRFRGEPTQLSPGAMLVTDGKTIDVELTGSGRHVPRNLQLMADQTTSCVTGVAVHPDECAAGVLEAYRRSLDFMGGRAPEAILHDGKPPYADRHLCEAIAPVLMIQATPASPENKAVAEGLFSDFEQQVGSIHIDDSSPEAIATSAVAEVARAFYAGLNHAQRAELKGKSREAVLRWFVPSPEQLDRDRRFLRDLRANHQATGRRARELPESRQLLDEAWRQHDCLRDKDPRESLRRYLAYCQPSAVRQALAIFATKVEQGAVEEPFAHRYLAAIVNNCQDEYELLRCEQLLLDSTRAQGQWWTAALEKDLQILCSEHPDPLDLVKLIAERAALAGLPIEGAFWTEQLLHRVAGRSDLLVAVRAFLCRLHEAPYERRLALIDRLAATEALVS